MIFFKKIGEFLAFIRWFHSLLALFPFVTIFLLIRNDPGFQVCEFSTINFFLVCVCVEAILISGVILNDLVDTGIDQINKSKKRSIHRTISFSRAKGYFVLFSTIGVGLSFYIAIFIVNEWIYIGVGAYFLSVIYNLYLKRLPLIGNCAMALLAAFVPLVIPLLLGNCIFMLENDRIEVLIYVYASLVFLITIPRELTLDISDKSGDEEFGYKTLPIVIGSRRSKCVVIFFIVLTIVLSFFAMTEYAFLIIPFTAMDIGLCYFLYRLPATEKRLNYIKTCRQLWIFMIIGMIGSTIEAIV